MFYLQRLSPNMPLQLASDTILRMLRARLHHNYQGQVGSSYDFLFLIKFEAIYVWNHCIWLLNVHFIAYYPSLGKKMQETTIFLTSSVVMVFVGLCEFINNRFSRSPKKRGLIQYIYERVRFAGYFWKFHSKFVNIFRWSIIYLELLTLTQNQQDWRKDLDLYKLMTKVYVILVTRDLEQNYLQCILMIPQFATRYVLLLLNIYIFGGVHQ